MIQGSNPGAHGNTAQCKDPQSGNDREILAEASTQKGDFL